MVSGQSSVSRSSCVGSEARQAQNSRRRATLLREPGNEEGAVQLLRGGGQSLLADGLTVPSTTTTSGTRCPASTAFILSVSSILSLLREPPTSITTRKLWDDFSAAL